MALERVAFPHPQQATAHPPADVLPPSLHPGAQPAPLPHTTLPCSLATAPLTAPRAGISANHAAAFWSGGVSPFIGCGLAGEAGERRRQRSSGLILSCI